MPQPDEKTVTGREVDSFDNLVREQEVQPDLFMNKLLRTPMHSRRKLVNRSG